MKQGTVEDMNKKVERQLRVPWLGGIGVGRMLNGTVDEGRAGRAIGHGRVRQIVGQILMM